MKNLRYAKVLETPGWERAEVLVNGEKLSYVQEANADEGWVIVFHPEGGDVCGLRVCPHQSKIYGKVEILVSEVSDA